MFSLLCLLPGLGYKFTLVTIQYNALLYFPLTFFSINIAGGLFLLLKIYPTAYLFGCEDRHIFQAEAKREFHLN